MACFWWWTLFLPVLFLLLLTLLPVTYQACLTYRQNRLLFKIQIKIWLFTYKKSFIFSKRTLFFKETRSKAGKESKSKGNKWPKSLKIFSPPVLFLLYGLKIDAFRWHTVVGLYDAAQTGMAVGYLWGIKSFLLMILNRLAVFLRRPEVAIVPDFFRPSFDTVLEMTVSVRLFHILSAVIKAGYIDWRNKHLSKILPSF